MMQVYRSWGESPTCKCRQQMNVLSHPRWPELQRRSSLAIVGGNGNLCYLICVIVKAGSQNEPSITHSGSTQHIIVFLHRVCTPEELHSSPCMEGASILIMSVFTPILTTTIQFSSQWWIKKASKYIYYKKRIKKNKGWLNLIIWTTEIKLYSSLYLNLKRPPE